MTTKVCTNCPLLRWDDRKNHTECALGYRIEFVMRFTEALYVSNACQLSEILTLDNRNYKPVDL